jgi:hypothetical protein
LAFALASTALGAIGVPRFVWFITLGMAVIFAVIAIAGTQTLQNRWPWLAQLPLVADQPANTSPRGARKLSHFRIKGPVDEGLVIEGDEPFDVSHGYVEGPGLIGIHIGPPLSEEEKAAMRADYEARLAQEKADREGKDEPSDSSTA